MPHQQLGGEVRDVVIQGSTLFTAEGARLAIYDVADSSNPVQLGEIVPNAEPIFALLVDGNYAYIVSQNQMSIVDVSQTNSPTVIGRFTTTGGGDLAKSGNLIYLASYFRHISPSETVPSGLRVIDVTTPSAPAEIGFFETDHYDKIVRHDNYVYMSKDSRSPSDGLQVVDVSDPASIQLTAQLNGDLHNFTIAGDTLYTRNYDIDSTERISIFSLADPAVPLFVKLHEVFIIHSVGILEANGDNLYISGGDSLFSFDISTPQNPTFSSVVQLPFDQLLADARAFSADGTHAVTAHRLFGFQLLDISADPPLIQKTETSPLTYGSFVETTETGLIVHNGAQKLLSSYSLTDEGQAPVLEDTAVIAEGDVQDMLWVDEFLYVTTSEKLIVYSLTASHQLTERGSIEYDFSAAHQLSYAGGRVFITPRGFEKILEYDVSNPDNPIYVREHVVDLSISTSFVVDDLLYVTSLDTVNIINLDTGTVETAFELDTNGITDLLPVDDMIYVTTSHNSPFEPRPDDYQLITIDYSNALIPNRVDSDEIGGIGHKMIVSDDKLFIATETTGTGELSIFDLANPLNPTKEATASTFGTLGGNDIAIVNMTAYIADAEAGLWIGRDISDGFIHTVYLPIITQ